ncbi:MAG: YggS family pyridoxal phosphate-dependent enzyme [bacterium JZ-2024 1]
MLKDRLELIYERIENARMRSGCTHKVVLLAAVKGRPVDMIREAIEGGVRFIGENRLDEAMVHQEALGHFPVRWEFIGKVQSRKLPGLAERFHRIQSLEDLGHAQKLNRLLQDKLPGTQYPVLIEVNIAEETTKQGIVPAALYGFAEDLAKFAPSLVIEGMSVMPPETSEPEASRPHFVKARELYEGLARTRLPNVHATCLSMGTSQDFEVAIEEGATMVRLGRILFE